MLFDLTKQDRMHDLFRKTSFQSYVLYKNNSLILCQLDACGRKRAYALKKRISSKICTFSFAQSKAYFLTFCVFSDKVRIIKFLTSCSVVRLFFQWSCCIFPLPTHTFLVGLYTTEMFLCNHFGRYVTTCQTLENDSLEG